MPRPRPPQKRGDEVQGKAHLIAGACQLLIMGWTAHEVVEFVHKYVTPGKDAPRRGR